jgi:hypothetical protein
MLTGYWAECVGLVKQPENVPLVFDVKCQKNDSRLLLANTRS